MAMNCGAVFAWPLKDPVKYKQKSKQIKCVAYSEFQQKTESAEGVGSKWKFISLLTPATSPQKLRKKKKYPFEIASEMRFFGIRLDRIDSSLCVCTLALPDKTRRWKTLFTLHTHTPASGPLWSSPLRPRILWPFNCPRIARLPSV